MTGAIPVTVAVAVCAPASGPRVHSTDAAPSELVREVGALNDPDEALQTTVASETFRPCASITLIVKGSGNLVPTSGDT